MLFDARYGAMRGGAIEAMMLVAGLVELGKYLRLPTHAFLGFSDAKVFDQQAAAESAAGLMLAAWEGANCIFGPGMLYSERSTDYAKLVVDNELCGQMLRLARGVTVNAETLAVEQFAAARADEAAFMALDHTLRHYRAETSLPGKVIDVTPFSEWQQAGCPTALDRARAAVERLRAERRPGPLGAAAAARLDAVLRELMAAHGIAALPEGPA
jgi:trimethylamine--corrinoid protein Co-methyltransferase